MLIWLTTISEFIHLNLDMQIEYFLKRKLNFGFGSHGSRSVVPFECKLVCTLHRKDFTIIWLKSKDPWWITEINWMKRNKVSLILKWKQNRIQLPLDSKNPQTTHLPRSYILCQDLHCKQAAICSGKKFLHILQLINFVIYTFFLG